MKSAEVADVELLMVTEGEAATPVILKSSTNHRSFAPSLSSVIRILRLLTAGSDEIVTVLKPSVVLAPPPPGVKSTGEVLPSYAVEALPAPVVQDQRALLLPRTRTVR